jgi:acyl-CoA synthetase (AMP-forming)/AMP-acid ligase II
VEDRFHRADFWAAADEMEVTWLNLVPAIIGVLGNQPAPDNGARDRIRFARSASSPLPRAVQQRFEAMSGIGILDTYGMTEAASQIAANPIAPTERRLGSVGRPIGVTVRIVDDDGNNLATGEIGNVEIEGPEVIDSYLGPRAMLIPARNACGWLHTGDMGWHDADGYLYLEGRKDDRINRGGEKIYPREIEDVLGRHPLVANAVVVGRPHSLLGSEAVACIQSHEHLDPEAAERLCCDLTAVCARLLSRQKRPARIFVVDSLPSGPTGKVARRRLQAAVIDGTIETRNEW